VRRGILFVLLAAGLASAMPAAAIPPVPYAEILETVRELAADELGVKKSDIDTLRSLAAHGMTEKQLHALVIAIEDEFGVVLPDNEVQQAKWNDPVTPLSVRRLADLVYRQQQSPR